MYLVMFYQPYINEHRVIVSEPMDFGTEETFTQFLYKVNAQSVSPGLFKYKPSLDTNEPELYIKVVGCNKFTSDTDLTAAVEFRY